MGRYSHVDNLYESASNSVLKLDKNKALDVLQEEIDMVKLKADSENVTKTLMNNLMKTEMTPELENYMMNSIGDPKLPFPAKFSVIEKMTQQDPSKRAEMLERIMSDYMNPNRPTLTKDDIKIIKFLQTEIKKFITKGHKGLLSLTLDALEVQSTKYLFVGMIGDIISDSNITFDREDMILLLQKPEPAKSIIIEGLCKRQELNPEEKSVLNFKGKQEDFVFDKQVIKVSRADKPKPVLNELNTAYERLSENLMTPERMSRSARRGAVVFSGDSSNEKIYLGRAFANNEGLAFIYVNMAELITNNKELSAFSHTLKSSAPAVVCLDNFKAYLDMEANSETKPKIKILSKAFKELQKEENLYIYAVAEEKHEYFSENSYYETLFENKSRGNFINPVHHNAPTYEEREAKIKEFFDRLNSDRKEMVNEKEVADYLLEQTYDNTEIEFISYMTNYLAYSVLGVGHLVVPQDYDKVSNQFPAIGVRDSALEDNKDSLLEALDYANNAEDYEDEYNELEGLNAPPKEEPSEPINSIDDLEERAEEVVLEPSPKDDPNFKFNVI